MPLAAQEKAERSHQRIDEMIAKAPTKSDLLLVLKDLSQNVSNAMLRAIENEKEAEEKLGAYERKNKTLVRLRADLSKASSRRFALRRKEAGEREALIRQCRQAIRLNGVTEETISLVRQAAKRYGP